MVVSRVQHKVQFASQNRDPAVRRQALIFGLAKIRDKADRRRGQRFGAQQSDAPRLDQSKKRRGTAGHQPAVGGRKLGAVIGNQPCPQCQKPKG